MRVCFFSTFQSPHLDGDVCTGGLEDTFGDILEDLLEIRSENGAEIRLESRSDAVRGPKRQVHVQDPLGRTHTPIMALS